MESDSKTGSADHAARKRSEAEREEMRLMGVPERRVAGQGPLDEWQGRIPGGLRKWAIRASMVLNEAPDYPQPTSFSRGIGVELTAGATHLFLSGTASIGANGETLYPGDFRAQCWRAYRNLTQLLAAADATWQDVVRCTCYLRDIDRDYGAFNEVRTELFSALGLDPLPASTAIQARLCRSDLLVEIEAHAIIAARGVSRRSEAEGGTAG